MEATLAQWESEIASHKAQLQTYETSSRTVREVLQGVAHTIQSLQDDLRTALGEDTTTDDAPAASSTTLDASAPSFIPGGPQSKRRGADTPPPPHAKRSKTEM